LKTALVAYDPRTDDSYLNKDNASAEPEPPKKDDLQSFDLNFIPKPMESIYNTINFTDPA
jgi:hypothetical protein